MSKIATIHGGHNPQEPCGAVVSILEQMLTRAKAGEIRSVALAYTMEGPDFGTAWEGEAGTRNGLCAAVNVLAVRYNNGLAGLGD